MPPIPPPTPPDIPTPPLPPPHPRTPNSLPHQVLGPLANSQGLVSFHVSNDSSALLLLGNASLPAPAASGVYLQPENVTAVDLQAAAEAAGASAVGRYLSIISLVGWAAAGLGLEVWVCF